MQVVHPETIEIFSHFSHIGQHLFPGSWRVWRFVSISYSDQISPNVDLSPQIVVFFGDDKQLSRVIASDPPVVEGVKLAINAFNSWEIFVDEGVGVIETSVGIIEVVVPDLVHCVSYHLRDPFILNSILPFVVEGLNSKGEVVLFVSQVQLDPFVQVSNSDP